MTNKEFARLRSLQISQWKFRTFASRVSPSRRTSKHPSIGTSLGSYKGQRVVSETGLEGQPFQRPIMGTVDKKFYSYGRDAKKKQENTQLNSLSIPPDSGVTRGAYKLPKLEV